MKKHTTEKRSRTNWAKIDAPKDKEIDTSDIPEQGKAFFKRAILRLPEPKTAVTIRLDRQVLNWFKAKGRLSDADQRPPQGLYGSAQRMRRGQPTVLLVRRGRTIRMCSLDARSERQSGHPRCRKERKRSACQHRFQQLVQLNVSKNVRLAIQAPHCLMGQPA